MNQNLKFVLIFFILFLSIGLFLFFCLKTPKIISPIPEKLDISVMFSPAQTSENKTTKTP